METSQYCKNACRLFSTEVDSHEIQLHFRPVSTYDIPLLRKYFNRWPSRSCDFSVGGVLIWADYYDYKIAEAQDSLLIMGRMPGTEEYIFYPPVGPMSELDFEAAVAQYATTRGISGYILPATEHLPSPGGDSMPHSPGIIEGMTEYLYDVEKFKTYAGRKMEKKRNHLNYFNHHYPHVTERAVSSKLAAQLISFTIAFSTQHEDDVADYECRQLIDEIRDFDRYPYFGIALYDGDTLIGYTFGEAIGDTFVIHAEKGDINYRGVYQALASRLARAVAERYPDVVYLNREDDMGFDHLRQSKLSYHPSLFIAKHLVAVP